jgi:hypothetical protein
VENLKETPFGVNVDVSSKTDRKKTECEVVNWIQLAQYMVHRSFCVSLCAGEGDE